MAKQNVTRQEQKELTRTGLIQSASRLFIKNGISNTATADVAKAQRVSHGTVFVHFPTREELILAVIDDFGIKLSQKFGHGMNQKIFVHCLNSTWEFSLSTKIFIIAY